MDSEDDEDLKQAIALSLGQNHSAGLGQSSKETIDQKSDIQEKPAYGISGLDRKQDEQNRLARKRRAEISPPAPRKRQNEVIRQDHISDLTASPARSEPMPSLQAKPDINHLEEHRGQPRVLQYPRGTIKKTWAFGQPRDGDIKIEEILQKQDLNIAVLSAFQWDVEWLLTKIDMAKTKMIFVMQAKEDAIRQQYRAETSNMPNLRLCFPPMAGQVNCMHSKLQLLFYKEHLRIVIPSANLVPYDWGEGGTMENTVFLIDLPRLSKEAQEATEAQKPLTSFGQELVYFLEAMGLQDDVVQGVLKFDFGGTKHLALIHSIGGSHTGETWRRTGYCGLGRAVKSLGLSCKGPLEVDFV
ncbi:MAG: hypothetical protein M1812_003836, partial [Candelaria pacifica]